ncbi:MAG: hypothetical protein Fur0022_47490 [Anaerolineales bacterium]
MISTPYTFILHLGWFQILVDCSEVPRWVGPLQKRYARFLASRLEAIPPFCISLLPGQSTLPYPENKLPAFTEQKVIFTPPGWEGEIDLPAQTGWMRPGSAFILEEVDYFLRVVTSLQAFRTGGLLFHAAGIVRAEKAYAFLGHSGAGKTTISRLSGEEHVMNDDLILLYPTSPGWSVYSTPFFNPKQVTPCSVFQAPLAGLYCLAKDSQVYLEKVSSGQALAEIIANIPIISANRHTTVELLTRCQTLLTEVPMYRLHFRKDASFWGVIEKGQGGG